MSAIIRSFSVFEICLGRSTVAFVCILISYDARYERLSRWINYFYEFQPENNIYRVIHIFIDRNLVIASPMIVIICDTSYARYGYDLFELFGLIKLGI